MRHDLLVYCQNHLSNRHNLFQVSISVRNRNLRSHPSAYLQENDEMDVERIRRVLDSLMILSFLIFCALAAMIVLTNFPLTTKAISLPFAFLFISLATLAVTGQIDENPAGVDKQLVKWLFVCVFGVLMTAFTFTIS